MRIACSASLCLLAGAIVAQDTPIVGPRSLGMGGTGVAVADDHTVQFQNPGALGFFNRDPQDGERLMDPNAKDADVVSWTDNNNLRRKGWGFGLDLQFGAQVEGALMEQIAVLADIDYQRLGNQGIRTSQDLNDIMRAVSAIDKLDDPGNAVKVDVNAGANLRIGHFAVGARMYSEIVGAVANIDRINLGLGLGGPAMASDIAGSGAPQDGQVLLLTPAQQAELGAAMGGGANATTALRQIDFQARSLGFSAEQLSVIYPYLLGAAQSSSALGQGLDDNTTSVLATGYGIAEIPVSYGFAINQYLSVGVNLKYLLGRVYGTRVLVFKADADTIIDEAQKTNKQTSNFGIDVGLMARYHWVQVGLTGRNLNQPKFKGPTTSTGYQFPDDTLDPQVTFGAAFIPWETLSITGDVDLLATDSLVAGKSYQRGSLGAEWNVLHFLALRGGIYQNLAESGRSPVVTAGLGFDLWLLRTDLAAACSLKRRAIAVDGTKYEVPEEFRGSFQIALDF